MNNYRLSASYNGRGVTESMKRALKHGPATLQELTVRIPDYTRQQISRATVQLANIWGGIVYDEKKPATYRLIETPKLGDPKPAGPIAQHHYHSSCELLCLPMQPTQ